MMGKMLAQNLNNNIIIENIYSIIECNLSFILPRIRANKRIGPHNRDIISIFIGSLLGDGTLYNYKENYRFRFEQKNTHYLF
jgi:hypothetical protein